MLLVLWLQKQGIWSCEDGSLFYLTWGFMRWELMRWDKRTSLSPSLSIATQTSGSSAELMLGTTERQSLHTDSRELEGNDRFHAYSVGMLMGQIWYQSMADLNPDQINWINLNLGLTLTEPIAPWPDSEINWNKIIHGRWKDPACG